MIILGNSIISTIHLAVDPGFLRTAVAGCICFMKALVVSLAEVVYAHRSAGCDLPTQPEKA